MLNENEHELLRTLHSFLTGRKRIPSIQELMIKISDEVNGVKKMRSPFGCSKYLYLLKGD
jgi:hypothetical protein